jgi:16S rRNA (guanine527-N7)-methyltransferase
MCFTESELGWKDLPGLFPEFEAPGRWLPLLQAHAEILASAEPRVRVSAVARRAIVRRQYAESLEQWRIATDGGQPSVAVDIGPGGGFPGLVAAAVSPDVHMHLVEPLQKRAALLKWAVVQLDLANVTVHAVRAEEGGRGPLRDSADVVTARAVAEMRQLIEYTAPFARPGGHLALAKGSGLVSELEVAANALSELGCRLLAVRPMRPAISSTIAVALFEKDVSTAQRYPRRAGMPGKRPI